MKQSTPAEKHTKLYIIQDQVLCSMSGHFGPFYFSGGAALSRFHLNHRFTYDLDLSVSLLSCFQRKAAPVVELLKTPFQATDCNAGFYPRYFHLWTQGSDSLRISLSNDNFEQVGLPVTAGREPKDMFSLLGVPSPIGFNKVYLTAKIERNSSASETHKSTIESLPGREFTWQWKNSH